MTDNGVTSARRTHPAWASALGVVAIVLGVFLTAYHGTEWMKNPVVINAMPEVMPPPPCPEDELQEEGLSLAECEFMLAHVEGLVLSMPDGFPGAMAWLGGIGTLLAFSSVVVGGALVNNARVVKAAIVVFAGLALIDLLQFMVVVNAGPIIRDRYLWHVVLWFLLHLMMIAGAVAGRDIEADAGRQTA